MNLYSNMQCTELVKTNRVLRTEYGLVVRILEEWGSVGEPSWRPG